MTLAEAGSLRQDADQLVRRLGRRAAVRSYGHNLLTAIKSFNAGAAAHLAFKLAYVQRYERVSVGGPFVVLWRGQGDEWIRLHDASGPLVFSSRAAAQDVIADPVFAAEWFGVEFKIEGIKRD